MPDWKHVKITFPTENLEKFIEPVKRTVQETNGEEYHTVYGVTNTKGITVTGKKASKDISNYITIDEGCFAYNPYRINVGSVGFNNKNIKGCVSPAYVVFKTRPSFSPEFLFLYLKSDFGNHLINWHGNRGGVRNALRYDDLCKIDVPKIDFKEQIVLLKKIQKTRETISEFYSGLDNQLSLLKKLRQQILQEAIEGKLTADWRKKNTKLISGENHASKLLEKIKAEKERLIKDGKIKKEKPLAPISDDEKPFDLPDGWVWSRIDSFLANTMYALKAGPFGSSLTKSMYKKYGYKVYGQEQVISQNPYFGNYYIDEDKYRELKSCAIKSGDILISLVGTIGKLLILPKGIPQGIINPRLIKLTLHNLISPKYFALLYSSANIQSQLKNNASGQTMDVISIKILNRVIFPLPPLAEQQAIFERVDKLMTMIDELEKQVTERKDKSERLMQSVLREAFEQ
ncbi:MAG: restriction endonuclease subunit S [Smithella sp.]|jgi:type I restriction enzyme S subunit